MSKRFSASTPFFMRFLDKHLKDWIQQEDAILAHPKESAKFAELTIVPRRISITGERVWRFSFNVPIIPPELMKKEYVAAYQRLKNMECALEWRGFLRRKPVFKADTLLQVLSKRIPTIQKNNVITNALNSDLKILDLVKKVKPEEMCVSLFSWHLPVQTEDEYLKVSEHYYNNPDRVVWVITLEKDFSTIMGNKRYERIVDGIFNIGNLTAAITKDISHKERPRQL